MRSSPTPPDDPHPSHRLRARGRVRRRLPRGGARDPAARRSDRRPEPRHRAARRAPRRPYAPKRASLHPARGARGGGRPSGRNRAPRGGRALRRRPRARRPRQRAAVARVGAGGRRRGSDRRVALAAPARAAVGDLPRPRPVRARRRPPGRRRGAARRRRAARDRRARHTHAPAAGARSRRGARARTARRRLRQREPRPDPRAHDGPRPDARNPGRDHVRRSQRGGHGGADLRRRAVGRDARVRGRVGRRRFRREPRRRRRGARRHARRRAAAHACAMIGSPHVHHRLTDSTTARARGLALNGAPHGTLVTADEQSAGRGRQGRSWSAAPGDALLMSLLLRDVKPLLPLAAAVAVCEAIAPLEAAIKWPNDVWLERRKVAGILLEGRPQEGWAIVGIGLNVRTREFPPELAGTATSLALAGHDTTLPAARDALLRALDRWIETPDAEILTAWRARDALRGEYVRWANGEGTAAGISDTGALIVETPAGARTELDAGEVHLSR